MPRTSLLSPFFFPLLIVSLVSCQYIGGLDELHLGAGTGGLGGADGSNASSGAGAGATSAGVGGAGGAPTMALWSKRFGDGNSQYVTDIAVDAAENIFVVGSFLGTIDFGTGSLLATAGDYDAFLAKLDKNGKTLWATRFGGAGPDRIEAVDLTPAGDPVVAGSYGAAFSIGMTNFSHGGQIDAFVIRFSGTDGSLVWRQRFGDMQNQRCGGVAVVPMTEDVYCFGDFSGTFTLGTQTFTSAGTEDLAALRFSSNGTFAAGIQAGDAQSQSARRIVVNGAGAAYAIAKFDGTVNWGPVTSAGMGDVFLGRFLNTGGVDWALRMGDSNTQQPNGLTHISGTAGIGIVGDFEGATDFGGKAISSKGGFDGFVSRVDPTGAVTWIRTIGDDPSGVADDQYVADVASTNDGTLFVTGYVAGTVNFGGGLIAGPSDTDLFIMRFDPMGQSLWALRRGSDNSQFGRAIATSGTDSLVVAGDFRNTLDFGNEPLVSAGSNDIFIAKLSR